MELHNFLIDLANTIEIDPSYLTPEFNIKTGSEWDSLAFISTIVLVDKYFGIVLDSDDLSNITYVNDLTQLINSKAA